MAHDKARWRRSEVFRLTAEGYSGPEIADALGISASHVRRIRTTYTGAVGLPAPVVKPTPTVIPAAPVALALADVMPAPVVGGAAEVQPSDISDILAGIKPIPVGLSADRFMALAWKYASARNQLSLSRKNEGITGLSWGEVGDLIMRLLEGARVRLAPDDPVAFKDFAEWIQEILESEYPAAVGK